MQLSWVSSHNIGSSRFTTAWISRGTLKTHIMKEFMPISKLVRTSQNFSTQLSKRVIRAQLRIIKRIRNFKKNNGRSIQQTKHRLRSRTSVKRHILLRPHSKQNRGLLTTLHVNVQSTDSFLSHSFGRYSVHTRIRSQTQNVGWKTASVCISCCSGLWRQLQAVGGTWRML